MTTPEALPPRPAQVAQAAAKLGLVLEVHTFPQGTRTAADAARAIGCDVAAIVKSLIFVAEEQSVLVLTSGANRVDEAKLAALLGSSRVRKADAAEVREATGYAIGGTPPFGHATRVEVLIDPGLTAIETVWAAAGTPEHVFPIRSADLVRVTGGHVADIAVAP